MFCQAKENNASSCRNHPLRSLSLDGTNVTAVGLASILRHFPNITNLEHHEVLNALHIIYTDIIRNNTPSDRFEIFKLDELFVHNTAASDLDSNFLKMCTLLCPLVTSLNIHRLTSQAQMDALQGFQRLKKINLTDSKYVLFSPLEFPGKYLQEVHILNAKVSVESIVKFCPNLKSLMLCGVEFEPVVNASYISKLTFQHLEYIFLMELDLAQYNTMKSIKAILSTAPALKVIKFSLLTSLTLEFVNSIIDYSCMRMIQEFHTIASDIAYPAATQLLMAAPNLNLYKIRNCKIKILEYEEMKKLRPSVKFDFS